MRDLKALATRARGLAPPALIQQARPGAVFAVNDHAVVLPEERLGGTRTEHATRRVIIVQQHVLITSPRPCTLSVIPCSASQAGVAGDWDLLLDPNEGGFDASNVVAYVSLLQPVLKSDLVKCYGYVRDATLLEIQTRIAKNLGLIPTSSLDLPPRIKISKSDDILTPTGHAVVHYDEPTNQEH